MYTRVLLSFFFLFLVACSPEEFTGPGEIRWDREVCKRCNMSVGDRFYAAQVRGAPAEEKTELYKFDDIGCAVIWLEKQDWKNNARTEIWVTDHNSGKWIDARSAHYVKDKISPMNYGLGAQEKNTKGAIDYSQAMTHINMSERERQQRGGSGMVDHSGMNH